jgi:hypothetical protein
MTAQAERSFTDVQTGGLVDDVVEGRKVTSDGASGGGVWSARLDARRGHGLGVADGSGECGRLALWRGWEGWSVDVDVVRWRDLQVTLSSGEMSDMMVFLWCCLWYGCVRMCSCCCEEVEDGGEDEAGDEEWRVLVLQE